mmetsp:Transcript_13433/g.28524  ORF Transcript_13433/g.28524 Transcript_13433/m.28524 type:complete len:246 (+) Transcript_13433:1253-1990(+)
MSASAMPLKKIVIGQRSGRQPRPCSASSEPSMIPPLLGILSLSTLPSGFALSLRVTGATMRTLKTLALGSLLPSSRSMLSLPFVLGRSERQQISFASWNLLRSASVLAKHNHLAIPCVSLDSSSRWVILLLSFLFTPKILVDLSVARTRPRPWPSRNLLITPSHRKSRVLREMRAEKNLKKMTPLKLSWGLRRKQRRRTRSGYWKFRSKRLYAMVSLEPLHRFLFGSSVTREEHLRQRFLPRPRR